jgi:hypothetical protein
MNSCLPNGQAFGSLDIRAQTPPTISLDRRLELPLNQR